MIVVTGAAGFIGSNVVAELNDLGRTDVVAVDWLGTDQKWRNLRKRQLADIIRPERLTDWLKGRNGVEAVVHMGAISTTTATDGDEIVEKNLRSSIDLLDWCSASDTPFIYASSAATYGDGAQGFDDSLDLEALTHLRPLNLYGWSKHLFDQALLGRQARGEPLPPRWVGLKFFNVFGPNEYHKGDMMSVVAKNFDTARAGETVRLFKSHRPGIADGDQRRDFIYIRDIVNIVAWFLDGGGQSGLYNAGTGVARSFRELIEALYRSLGQEPKIQYIDMPMTIRDKYQYFTQSSMSRLRDAGYEKQFTSLEAGVDAYVKHFLTQADNCR